jgi:hypothetical protein
MLTIWFWREETVRRVKYLLCIAMDVIDIEGTAFGPQAAERAIASALAGIGTIRLERRAA